VALTCGVGFFGADHILFGTDYPYPGGANQGAAIGEVIKSIDQLKVSEEDKAKIFSGNARRLMIYRDSDSGLQPSDIRPHGKILQRKVWCLGS